ncbi:BQ5605_C014g07653 [Microbotryum silenes-dioicae]|uniref:NADH dehydrogenase [ubiquinone] iron-sulfur protein 4, mitochondrial n=1 Tax=Microbotryum silenes-dioicae TaxID=796604 RepID=A0A2X0LY42_9BASI|nr:BQ5605_C014g07653 [Microbotryum silenes-dioicae]
MSFLSAARQPAFRSFSTARVALQSSSSSSSSSDAPAAPASNTAVAPVRAPGAVAQAGVVSGVPDEVHHRSVRIFRPSPPSSQSAKATSHHWRIDWDILQGAGRWENPLMGWASTADYLQGTHLKFNTKDAAIHFCEKQGYQYFVQEPQQAKFKPKSYASNYNYSAKPLRIAHTK